MDCSLILAVLISELNKQKKIHSLKKPHVTLQIGVHMPRSSILKALSYRILNLGPFLERKLHLLPFL